MMTASDGGGPQPGLVVGPTSEFSLSFRVRKGQGPSLRGALLDLQDTPGYRPGDYGMAVPEDAMACCVWSTTQDWDP